MFMKWKDPKQQKIYECVYVFIIIIILQNHPPA